MLISVVIPTCHRNALLERCLKSLNQEACKLDKSLYEIVVTDDGVRSTAETLLSTKFPWVRWMRGCRRGPAANRNAGARSARGKWLIFLDDDCVPATGWMQEYLRAINEAEPAIQVMAGSTYRAGEPPSLLWEAPHNPGGTALISCNMAIPRALFLDVAGFDERFPAAAFEDTELEARIRSLGIPVRFTNARVDHPLRRMPNPRKLANRWEARVIYALDQGASPFRILWGLPWHVLRIIGSRLRGPEFKSEYVQTVAVFAGEWLCVLWHTPGWVAKWSRKERSPFWVAHVLKCGPAPKFGF